MPKLGMEPIRRAAVIRAAQECLAEYGYESTTMQAIAQRANCSTGTVNHYFKNKEDDFDAISWEFLLNHHELTLHYSIYNGISVFPTKTKDARRRDNKAVVELANMIRGKLTHLDIAQHIA